MGDAHVIQAGTTIGNRYKVTRMVGGGGMKLVYQAEDLHLANRPCALAEMSDDFANQAARQHAVTAFQREADLLAKLDNPHIPRIYDRFSEGTRHFLVMEFVEGRTLERRMSEAGGKLPEAEALEITLQLASTLEYLHTQTLPVLHRDLKPSNVIITPSGLVKLIDFGIARYFRVHGNATVVGTPGYAAPEQYRGVPEIASDVYSLSALLHHMVSGRDPNQQPPFHFPALHSIAEGCNPLLASLVARGLEFEVTKRIKSVTEFKAILLAIKAAGLTSIATPARISSGVDSRSAAQSRLTGSLGSSAEPIAWDLWAAASCAKAYRRSYE